MADYKIYYLAPLEYYGVGYEVAYLHSGNIGERHHATLDPFFPEGESIGLDSWYLNGCTFIYPTYENATDSVSFKAEWIPLDHDEMMNQVVLKTASGKLAVYDTGFSDRMLHVKLGKLVTQEKRTRLYKFYRNICKGSLKTFQYIDATGTLYTVKFTQKMMNWTLRFWLKYDITIDMFILDKTDDFV